LHSILNIYFTYHISSHPDKIRTDDEKEKEELNAKYVEITKAYKALTDPEIKKNFEEYGHPDGRQPFQLGIALPLWLVESHNNFYVLAFYGVILGLFLPYYVGKWWYKALKYTRDRILNNTMALYFKELKENTSMKDFILMMASSYEFEEEIELKMSQEPLVAELWKNMVEVAEKDASIIDLPKVHNQPYVKKAFALIQSNLYKVQVQDAQLLADQQEILRRLLSLIHGALQITIAQGWLEPTIKAIEFSQIIVQGLRHKASPLLQLPYVDRQLVRYIKTHNKEIRNVYDLMKVPEAQRRKLLTDLSDSQYQELSAVGNKFPVLKAINTDVRVLGEDIITPGSIITLTIKINLKTIEQALKENAESKLTDESDNRSEHRPEVSSESLDDEEDFGRLLAKLDDGKDDDSGSPLTKASKLSQVPHVYAPYFPGAKQLQWWIIVGDRRNNRMLIPPTKVSELIDEQSVKFQFGGPENPGSYSFEIFIKSDSYFGVDIKEEFNVRKMLYLKLYFY
jgi:translocation protein SEC63